MESDRKRNWWVPAGLLAGTVLVLLCLYIGAYFATVSAVDFADSGPPVVVAIYSKCAWLNLRSFFQPIHKIDREWIRPKTWNPPPPP